MDNKFYTVDEIAKILNIHAKTVRTFIKEGKLKGQKVGKQWRVSEIELKKFSGDEKISNETTNGYKLVIKNEYFEDNPFDVDKMNDSEQFKLTVSTVVDIEEIDKNNAQRIMNLLIAAANSKDKSMEKSTVNVRYFPNIKKLRIMLWGNLRFTMTMFSFLEDLIKSKIN